MSRPAGDSLRVLIVDDDQLDRMSVRRALSSVASELELLEAADARGALASIAANDVDCMLLDFNLPDHDGLWVLQQLQSAPRRVPVIVLTGQEDPKTAAELMKSGAHDYLPKGSWTPPRLLQSIRQAIRLHRAESERAWLLQREKEARAQAEAERARLAAFIHQTPAFVLIMRGPEHVLEMVNQPVHALFGGQAPIGRSFDAAFPDGSGTFRPLLDRCFQSGEPYEGREIEIATKGEGGDVRRTYFSMMLQPQRDAEGRIEGLVSVSMDVTEQVLARRRVEALAEFQDQLIGIVSHDVRSPLAAILMSVRVLQRPGLDEAALRAVARIDRGGRRIDQIISLLLDFTRARIGGGIPIVRERIDLSELCSRAIEEFRGSHPQQLFDCHVGKLPVEVDPARLSQVLANLLDNAIKYGDGSSPVRVSAEQSVDKELCISVHNAGPPIPDEVRQEMFEPFRRGTQSEETIKKSLGLGLYIVREIVRAHGGSIRVLSDVKDGTTFTVVLPGAANNLASAAMG